jgi:hypothetical protein
MKKVLFFALMTALLFSCKSNVPETSTSDFDAFAEKVKQMNFDVQNTGDVLALIQLTGADFMPQIVNSPDSNEKYLYNDVMAAANIGVYMADGLYQLTYDEFNSGYMSLAAAKNIAAKLQFGQAFDELVLDRYSNDTTMTLDSVLIKINQGISNSQSILNEEDRIREYTAMIAGNYVEKLNILFTIVFEYNVDLPEESKLLVLRQLLLATGEYLKKVPNVIELAENAQKESDPGIIIAKLKEIDALRLQLKFADEPGKLTPALIFENQVLLDIYAKVKEVRTLIVALPKA